MGWNAANAIFDAVAGAMIEADVEDIAITHTLTALIRYLQSEDWDTADESLERFRNYPPVVEALRRCGVYKQCGWQAWPDDRQRWCRLELGHAGGHSEELGE